MKSFSAREMITISITDITDKGEGIGRLDGLTFFVHGALPGDTVLAKIKEVKKTYGVAKVKEILVKSPDRVKPPCPYYPQCGGCQIQDLSYEAQLRQKKQVVEDALLRIGKLEGVKVQDTLGMEEPFGYRNKSSIPVSPSGELGFYKKRSHEVIPMDYCLIQSDQADQLMVKMARLIKDLAIPPYDEATHTGLLRHVVVRSSKKTGEAIVILVTKGKALPNKELLLKELSAVPGLVGIVQNINSQKGNRILGREDLLLWGKDHLVDAIGHFDFKISPQSFFQVNNLQTDVLYQKALDFADIKDTDIVFDLYSGIGTISLFLSDKAKHVYGIEIVGPAIENAMENAKINEVENVTFIKGPAEEKIYDLLKEGIKPDVIMVDPPRKGLDESLVKEIINLAPKKLVYVSCKPSTLARDLALFCAGGYEIEQVQPVDMFPHTMHVETIVALYKID